MIALQILTLPRYNRLGISFFIGRRMASPTACRPVYCPRVELGATVLFNGSRAALPAMRQIYPDLRVFVISVSPDVLAERLHKRGRETACEITKRLERQVDCTDETAEIINNDGELATSVASFITSLQRPEEGGE